MMEKRQRVDREKICESHPGRPGAVVLGGTAMMKMLRSDRVPL